MALRSAHTDQQIKNLTDAVIKLVETAGRVKSRASTRQMTISSRSPNHRHRSNKDWRRPTSLAEPFGSTPKPARAHQPASWLDDDTEQLGMGRSTLVKGVAGGRSPGSGVRDRQTLGLAPGLQTLYGCRLARVVETRGDRDRGSYRLGSYRNHLCACVQESRCPATAIVGDALPIIAGCKKRGAVGLFP